jgi:hypothetical protein
MAFSVNDYGSINAEFNNMNLYLFLLESDKNKNKTRIL